MDDSVIAECECNDDQLPRGRGPIPPRRPQPPTAPPRRGNIPPRRAVSPATPTDARRVPSPPPRQRPPRERMARPPPLTFGDSPQPVQHVPMPPRYRPLEAESEPPGFETINDSFLESDIDNSIVEECECHIDQSPPPRGLIPPRRPQTAPASSRRGLIPPRRAVSPATPQDARGVPSPSSRRRPSREPLARPPPMRFDDSTRGSFQKSDIDDSTIQECECNIDQPPLNRGLIPPRQPQAGPTPPRRGLIPPRRAVSPATPADARRVPSPPPRQRPPRDRMARPPPLTFGDSPQPVQHVPMPPRYRPLEAESEPPGFETINDSFLESDIDNSTVEECECHIDQSPPPRGLIPPRRPQTAPASSRRGLIPPRRAVSPATPQDARRVPSPPSRRRPSREPLARPPPMRFDDSTRGSFQKSDIDDSTIQECECNIDQPPLNRGLIPPRQPQAGPAPPRRGLIPPRRAVSPATPADARRVPSPPPRQRPPRERMARPPPLTFGDSPQPVQHVPMPPRYRPLEAESEPPGFETINDSFLESDIDNSTVEECECHIDQSPPPRGLIPPRQPQAGPAPPRRGLIPPRRAVSPATPAFDDSPRDTGDSIVQECECNSDQHAPMPPRYRPLEDESEPSGLNFTLDEPDNTMLEVHHELSSLGVLSQCHLDLDEDIELDDHGIEVDAILLDVEEYDEELGSHSESQPEGTSRSPPQLTFESDACRCDDESADEPEPEPEPMQLDVYNRDDLDTTMAPLETTDVHDQLNQTMNSYIESMEEEEENLSTAFIAMFQRARRDFMLQSTPKRTPQPCRC